VPHIAKLLFQTSNHWFAIEHTLLGAGIMLICDIISQMPGFDITLPINAITSIGAPVDLVVGSKRKMMG
jgi:iron complex transport system permease protein